MSAYSQVVKNNEAAILEDWLKGLASSTRRDDLMDESELKRQANDFLQLFTQAAQSGTDIESEKFMPVRDFLSEMARTRTEQGFTPTETAMFILSMKQPIFNSLRQNVKSSPTELLSEMWESGNLIDKLALYTTDLTMQLRDRTIARQQEEMLELSTPVVKLWDGILALPLIGTLDSARTQVVMEALLSEIVATNSQVAIIDITGVPTVDTLVAQHLIKTITAARLMGADCYLSGIRPAIAQTIVHLGINLNDIQTKAKLSDAFAVALQRMNKAVVNVKATKPGTGATAAREN